MPVQEYLDIAISSTEPDNDLAWMNAVLSPSGADAPSGPSPPFSPDDASALELDTHLPPSSFRLQILHAWIAARGEHPAEVAGHA